MLYIYHLLFYCIITTLSSSWAMHWTNLQLTACYGSHLVLHTLQLYAISGLIIRLRLNSHQFILRLAFYISRMVIPFCRGLMCLWKRLDRVSVCPAKEAFTCWHVTPIPHPPCAQFTWLCLLLSTVHWMQTEQLQYSHNTCHGDLYINIISNSNIPVHM